MEETRFPSSAIDLVGVSQARWRFAPAAGLFLCYARRETPCLGSYTAAPSRGTVSKGGSLTRRTGPAGFPLPGRFFG
jgi:hypothetical protein